MSLLSDKDIKKELGKNIYIYPLNLNEIKGSSVNLKASKLAWSITTKRSIYDSQHNSIRIPSHDTGLIETEESIFVTKKISGSYHSKVKLVSKGLGHIGTTLDPEWVGPSLIAMHNHTDSDIEIKVGDSFVSIMFYYLNSKAIVNNNNRPGRPELLNNISVTTYEDEWLDEEWRSDPKKLKEKMSQSEAYKELEHLRKSKLEFIINPVSVHILVIIVCIIVFLIFRAFQSKWDLELKDYLVPISIFYLTVLTAEIINAIKWTK